MYWAYRTKGDAGVRGTDGEHGLPGAKGNPGQSGSNSVGGAVYNRWGRESCGSNSTRLYVGKLSGFQADQYR